MSLQRIDIDNELEYAKKHLLRCATLGYITKDDFEIIKNQSSANKKYGIVNIDLKIAIDSRF